MLAAHHTGTLVARSRSQEQGVPSVQCLPFDDEPVIMTDVLAFFPLSVTEVAMMATCPPAGAPEGAVYIVLAPLIVETGLNEPQAELGVQLQLTPAPPCHW